MLVNVAMPRENSKCRKWAKERRDRINQAFTDLAKQLPCYDPSVNICKIEILQKAASSIHELQDKIKKVLSSDAEKKTETEDIIKKLQNRVKKLLVRNEQLSNLLKDAGISVPSECGGIKKFKRKLPWSERISSEQAELLRKNEMEKENICSKFDHGKKKKTKTVNTGITQKPRTAIINRVKQKRLNPKRRKNCKKTQSSNCFIVLSQPTTMRGDINQQCFLITNQFASNIHKNTAKTGTSNTGVVSNTLVSPKSRTAKNLLQVNPSITSLGPGTLGPGTLILANGTILPILPQFQTLPALSNLLINSAVNAFPKSLNTLENQDNQIVASKSNSGTNIRYGSIQKLPAIKPKNYCLTKTTQVNKVPIPALTSRYSNNYFLLNEIKTQNVKPKDIRKPNKTEQTEDSSKTNKRETEKRKCETETETGSSSKKTKADRETEHLNEKNCATISNNHSNISVSANDPPAQPAAKNNKTELNSTDKETAENEINNLMKKPVTNKNERSGDIKGIPNDKKIHSVNINTTEKISNSNIFEKGQEMLVNDTANSQETFLSTTVTTTTSTTTTSHNVIKGLDLNLTHSELSNDIFASLQVPSGCQNPESTSPTAAFLLAFPLVSSGVKVTEVIDEENSQSQRGTPTLLQIGTMDSTKATQSQTETITSNLLNLDNFSFFPSKDVCGNFYNNYLDTASKANKVTVPSTALNTSNNSDIPLNRSIYVNVKSPCLPNCVAEPVKQNYNTYDLKTVNPTKEIISNIENCEKKSNNEKITEHINFNPNSQSNSKANTNYSHHSKDNQTAKSSDQKTQYSVPPSYSNSTCNFGNFNYRSETTKICNTCSYVNINRNYANPLYTNCSNYGYNYHPDTNFNQNYYKNIHRNDTKTYYPLNYENYTDYRRNEGALTGGYYETSYVKEKKNNSTKLKTASQNKPPINWMTTPDSRLQNSECLLNSFSKGDFSQTYPFSSYVTSSSTYFTATSTETSDANCIMEAKKCIDLPSTGHQRLDTEEKQFSWSPTKLPHFLDHPHNFVTSTLPTLVGDLALGNPLPFSEQKNDHKYPKENKELRHNNKISNYETQSNFLSVSQLVDHNKTECIPAKTSTRRNSGNRSKNIQQKAKRVSKQENKDLLSNCVINNDKICQRLTNNCNILTNNDEFSEQKNRNTTKNVASNYSAEALIGNQVPDESVNKRYVPPSNKSLGFLTENIISYFPPTDIPQDNYAPQNQNYQANNFAHNLCTCQSNSYSANSFIYTAPTITSTYLGANNFDSGSHDYLQDNLVTNVTTKDKHYAIKNFNNRQSNKDEKGIHSTICQNNIKKQKKRQTSDNNPGLASFEFPFLSMPGSNNSPILPDDFHSHTNFLPPTTPFTCKNSLYPKQNSDLSTSSVLPLHPITRSSAQYPEISPSVGTSLTNFNLSTIFPEINKGPMTDVFPDPRLKVHPHNKSCTSASPQVPFNAEPKFSFSA